MLDQKVVGIPRCLFYYNFYPLWKTFFEEIGAEVILSPYMSKNMLDKGINICTGQACLPIKVFFAHVLSLCGKVDYIFIPRLTSISKGEYMCPEIGGIPDMVRHSKMSELPKIIDVEINLKKSNSGALSCAMEIGRYFCCDKKQIKKAFYKAMEEHRKFRAEVKSGMLPSDILEVGRQENKKIVKPNYNLCILVIGHSYLVYDSSINMNMLGKIKAFGADIITLEMIDQQIIREHQTMISKKMFWNYGSRAVGGVDYSIKGFDVDGIICLTSFGCGIDSFVTDIVQRHIKVEDIPYITLTLDEHSAEAGMNTRLEAFIDMINWRKNKHAHNISAYG